MTRDTADRLDPALPDAGLRAAILVAADEVQGDCVAHLSDLVRQRSLLGDEAGAQALMADRFAALGLEVDRFDIDECAGGNGGCDLLTTCTNIPGSRTCSACPAGYNGTGATGWAWAYLGYTSLNGVAAWLILTRRV